MSTIEQGAQSREQGAGSEEQACTSWTHSRRVLISLAACAGMNAAVCRMGGVVARGRLEFRAGRFAVGGLECPVVAVGAVTLERDVVTIHWGEIA
jgi:hypothetical protein